MLLVRARAANATATYSRLELIPPLPPVLGCTWPAQRPTPQIQHGTQGEFDTPGLYKPHSKYEQQTDYRQGAPGSCLPRRRS